MDSNTRRKVAILSHALPPTPSGQAMMIGNLLAHFAPDEYCLISSGSYAQETYDAAYHHLAAGQTFLSPWLRKLPGISLDKDTPFRRTFRPLLKLYKRLRGDYQLSDAARLEDALERDLRQIIQQENCYALVACSGMPFETVAAYRACQATGIAFVPYILDYFSLAQVGGVREYALRHEAALLRGAAAIVVTNEFMGEEYRRLYGVESTIVRNPCHLHDLAQLDAAPPHLPADTFNIVYTGSVYAAHHDAFRNLIAAVARLDRADVAIHVYTPQRPLSLRNAELHGQGFHVHGPVNHATSLILQRQADVLLLALAFEFGYPGDDRDLVAGQGGRIPGRRPPDPGPRAARFLLELVFQDARLRAGRRRGRSGRAGGGRAAPGGRCRPAGRIRRAGPGPGRRFRPRCRGGAFQDHPPGTPVAVG